MSRNLSLGIIQVADLSVASLNVALMQLQNRTDEQRGLRGRALVHDRVRLDNPTASDDGVALGILLSGTAAVSYPFYMAPSTPLMTTPGTTYVEVASSLRQQVNFAQTASVEARVLVEGWGTGSGNGKGIAITTSAGTVIAEVTWNGSTPGLQVGSFTTVSLTTDQAIQLRAKGSSSTESLVLNSVVLDLRYAINIV